MKIKRILVTLFAVSMLTTALAIPASANNHEDKPFSFFKASATSSGTEQLEKKDDSNMYMKPTYLGTAYTARATASRESTSQRYWADNGYIYRIDVNNREYFMRNWVNDWGYAYGGIHAERISSGTASGVWSPDSV